jgi:phosphatidate phosphatase APP1
VLVGDTGQLDAQVYYDAILRHPGRIMTVVLREPGPGPDAQSLQAMEDIRLTGTPLLHGREFDGFAGEILRNVPATGSKWRLGNNS